MQMMAPEAAAAQSGPKTRNKEAGIASYDTKDGRLMLGAFTPAQYRKLAKMLEGLGHPAQDLASIKDWPDVWALGTQAKTALCDIFMTANADTWVTRLHAADLPAERIITLNEAVALPQLAARGYFQGSPNSKTPLPTSAFHMDGAPARIHKAPPALGEDTRKVLSEMGLSPHQIDALYAAGIVT